MQPKQIHADFIVIGSGIAGLSAATELCSTHTVAIITKSTIQESATKYAQGGIAVALKKDDTTEYHFKDTIKAGDGLCNEDSVRVLVEKGPECVNQLIQLGANFDKKNGQFDFTKEAAHSKRRILHAQDATGKEIEKTLGNHLLNQPNVTFYPNTSVIELITQNNQCFGCLALTSKTLIQFNATAVILATGGCGQLYSHSTNPPIATGDGIALAYQKGAIVQDMEFMQFHPTTLNIGDKKPISIFLISEAVRGEGAVLRNIHGERFMFNYHPDGELAPRDIVARAMYQENQKTKNHVYLDFESVKVDPKKRFPTITKRCKEAGYDIEKDFIPVSPAAHYFMGGIKTNIHSETSIHRLFAAGEVATLGLHGANRLASNSLLDGLVFGKEAAIKAKTLVKQPPIIHKINPNWLIKSTSKLSIIKATKQEIKTILWRQVSISRNQHDLEKALSQLQSLKKRLPKPCLNELVIEVHNMLIVATLITQAALQRKESRGAHYRSDFPTKDPLQKQVHLPFQTFQAEASLKQPHKK